MEDIKKLRRQIDDIDLKIIDLLYKRHKLSKSVGEYKIKNNIKILQEDRENKALSNRKKIAGKYGLDNLFIEKLFKLIFSNSRKIQKSKIIIVKL